MSSILKKGAGAFKPKAPIARRRPAPTVPSQGTGQPENTEAQPTTTPTQEPTPDAPREVAASSRDAESRPEPSGHPATTIATNGALAAPSDPSSTTKDVEAPSKSPEVNGVTLSTEESSSSTSIRARPAASDVPHDEVSIEPTRTTETTSSPPEQRAPARKAAEPATQSSEPEASPATSTSTPASLGGTPAPRAEPAPSTAIAKPRPIAETTAPEPPPDRPAEPVPKPSGTTTAVPSVENGEGSSASATKKTRQPAPRKPRKRKATAALAESGAEPGAVTEGPPKKKRAPRKKKSTTNGADGETQAEGAATGEKAAPKRKSTRKKKAADYAEDQTGEDGGGDEVYELSEGEETEKEKQKKTRRKRSATPEDAENQEVDHEQMVMADLTQDLRIGKKFSRYDELRDRMRKKRARQRLIRQGKLKTGEEIPDETGPENGTPARNASSTPAPPQPRPAPALVEEAPADGGQNLVIIDGQIQVDMDSMQVDRHAIAEQERGTLLTLEEDDFTHAVTNATYLKPGKIQPNFWTNDETVKFYHGLRMFGTDFNMISKMFGGAKTRRQVKLKFNREERANPVAVNRCIIGEKEVAMDLDAVRVDGEDLEESKTITDELARLREEQEAETRRLDEESAAEARRKKEELFGTRKGDAASRGKDKAGDEPGRDEVVVDEGTSGAAHDKEPAPGAMYGVGTDPDVIDETDLPPSSARGRGRGHGGGGRGRRGGKLPQMFAGGIGS